MCRLVLLSILHSLARRLEGRDMRGYQVLIACRCSMHVTFVINVYVSRSIFAANCSVL